VTFWTEFFLGVIAAATLLTALVQVSVLVYGWMLARRVVRLLTQFESEMTGVMESLNSVARDAARATALAAAQVERVDKLFGDVVSRIQETAATVQKAILAPLREGAAVVAGVRAALAVLRDLSRRSHSGAHSEDEEALFIG
jgi:hypothetical protein